MLPYKGLNIQQSKILKLLVSCKATTFLIKHDKEKPNGFIYVLPPAQQTDFTFDEDNFLEEDVNDLVLKGHLIENGFSSSGSTRFKITRTGTEIGTATL